MATAASRSSSKANAPTGLTLEVTPATAVAAALFVALASCVIYYLFVYSPVSDALVRENSRARTVSAALRQAHADERSYESDVAELNEARRTQNTLQSMLPDNPDIPGFIRSINTLAEASGLSITLIEPADEHTETYFVRVPVRLEVHGTYLALAKFLRSVSELPRIINMENINLAEPEEQDGQVRLRARILATTFRAVGTPPPTPAAGTHGPTGGTR